MVAPPSPPEAPRRALIAGCGDLGTRLGLRLAALGMEVIGLRRDPAGLPAPLQPLAYDLSTGAGRLPGVQFDLVVFCAAPRAREESVYRGLFVDGTCRVLDALQAQSARVLFVSSTSVYGQHDGRDGWVDEDTAPHPDGFNGRVLLEAESALHRLRPDAVVLRLTGLHGPGRGRLRARAERGEPGQARWSNRIHIEDAVAALVHVAGLPAPAGCYLVSDGAPMREDVLLDRLRAQLGLPSLGTVDGAVAGRRIDTARLRSTGWMPVHVDELQGP